MKSSNLIIICLTLIIGVSIWSFSNKKSNGSALPNNAPAVNVGAIKNVINLDANLGSTLNQEISQMNPQSDGDINRIASLINNYVEQAKTIPINNCPTDFAEAYYRHLGKWSNAAGVFQAHPHVEGSMENFTKNFFRGMVFDFGGPERDQTEWKNWIANLNQAQSEVANSWNEVEALEVHYGAK